MAGGGGSGGGGQREGGSTLFLDASPTAVSDCAAALDEGRKRPEPLAGGGVTGDPAPLERPVPWHSVLAAGSTVLQAGAALLASASASPPSNSVSALVEAVDQLAAICAARRPPKGDLKKIKKGKNAGNAAAAAAAAGGIGDPNGADDPAFPAVVALAVDLVLVGRGRIRRQCACLLNALERQHACSSLNSLVEQRVASRITLALADGREAIAAEVIMGVTAVIELSCASASGRGAVVACLAAWLQLLATSVTHLLKEEPVSEVGVGVAVLKVRYCAMWLPTSRSCRRRFRLMSSQM